MKFSLPMGIYDDLEQQTQPLLNLNLLRDNVILFGNRMSGKTTFLKTLLIRLHENANPDFPCEIYIMDFGGNLSEYGDLNLVAACFDSMNEENIRRIFKTIEKKLDQNIKTLRSKRFIDVYEKESSSDDPPKPTHLILIMDNVNSFMTDERYESYQDTLMKFCRDGLSKGLTVILSGSDIANGLSRYLNSFGLKIAFAMPSDKYAELFGFRVTEPMKVEGRGAVLLDGKIREFQCFLPFEDENKELHDFIQNSIIPEMTAEKLASFPTELTYDNVNQYLNQDTPLKTDSILVGLDYYNHYPISVNLQETHSIAIYGKKKFGKTNLLRILLTKIKELHPEFRLILLDDGRKQLEEFEHLSDMTPEPSDTDSPEIPTPSEEHSSEIIPEIPTPSETDSPAIPPIPSSLSGGLPPLPTPPGFESVLSDGLPPFPSESLPPPPGFESVLSGGLASDYSNIPDIIPPIPSAEIPPPIPAPSDADQPEPPEEPTEEISYPNCIRISSLDDFAKKMVEMGYCIAGRSPSGADVYSMNKNFSGLPTVFVLQSKMLFQSAGKSWIKVMSDMIADAEKKNYWVIYSDIKKIGNNDTETESQLNNSIGIAFLLDNIAEFINDRGNKSVFGEMDPKELKSEYAKCDVGDGYYYDIDGDEIMKLKFIKFDEIA